VGAMKGRAVSRLPGEWHQAGRRSGSGALRVARGAWRVAQAGRDRPGARQEHARGCSGAGKGRPGPARAGQGLARGMPGARGRLTTWSGALQLHPQAAPLLAGLPPALVQQPLHGAGLHPRGHRLQEGLCWGRQGHHCVARQHGGRLLGAHLAQGPHRTRATREKPHSRAGDRSRQRDRERAEGAGCLVGNMR